MVIDLADDIFRTAVDLAEHVKPHIAHSEEKDKRAAWVFILFEFSFFYVHLADRIAFDLLGPLKRGHLVDRLTHCLAEQMQETLFGEWSVEDKAYMSQQFFEKLNEASAEYERCRPLLDEMPRLFDKDNLFYVLAEHVAAEAGCPDNIDLKLRVHDLSIAVFSALDLVRRVKKAEREVQPEAS